MENEWYEEHFINSKVLISGQDKNGKEVEVELTDSQKNKLWDFNYDQKQERERFFRDLLSEV